MFYKRFPHQSGAKNHYNIRLRKHSASDYILRRILHIWRKLESHWRQFGSDSSSPQKDHADFGDNMKFGMKEA